MGGGMEAIFKMLPWKILMHADELGLNEDQIEAFRNRHAEAEKQLIRICGEIRIDIIDVKNAVMREEIDMQTAESKVREIGKLKGDKLMAMIQAMHDMRAILTPDQCKKVKKMFMSWFKKGGMPGAGMEEGEEESGEASEE
jgi:Spy/CpxP family protein refolding chaperone